MKNRRTHFMLAFLVPVVGCEHAHTLQPIETATQTRSENAAPAKNAVKLEVNTSPWPGEARIEREVTPVRVTIRNASSDPILIRYDDFEITTRDDGLSYRAIPPRDVSGAVEDDEPIDPVFRFSGFRSAPYGGYYSGIEPYGGPFHYDGSYHHTYYGYWDGTAELPTDDMLTRALPEGVVEPGGYVDGYLYFQKVAQPEGTVVTLHVELKTAEHDGRVASFELPYVVT